MKTNNEKLISFNKWFGILSMLLIATLGGCLNQKESASSGGVEERTIVSSGTGTTSLNPSVKSWPALGTICANASSSQAEQMVCKLDSILDEVAKSGKTLSDFENDILTWIQEASDLRNQVCQNSQEVTFLLEGTMQVLAARNLVALPFSQTTATPVNMMNPLVRKMIQAVVLETIQMGCSVDKKKMSAIFGANSSPTSGQGSSNGGGSVTPTTPTGSNGGGTLNPTTGGNGPGTAAGLCAILQQRYTSNCQSVYDAANCDLVKQECMRNKCVCN